MQGYALTQGTYRPEPASEEELWAAFGVVFSSQSVNDTSYKFGFLKAILDNLYNVDEELVLSFDQLFSKFAEIYWNLVVKYRLKQKRVDRMGRRSYIETILLDAKERYLIADLVPWEQLPAEAVPEVISRVKQKCKQNVVGALYGDTRELFYSFSKKEEWIRLSPYMYTFLCRHKAVIEKLNYYEWARFLEKVNEESATLRVLDKLDASSKRSNLSYYRRILYDEFEAKTCFYCGRPLRESSIHVDHFIPWSFIKDDKPLEFCAGLPVLQLREADRLAAYDYLLQLEVRNRELVQAGIAAPDLEHYRPELLTNVYDWAKANGYDGQWAPAR